MINLTPLTLSHVNDIFNSATGNVASYFYNFKTIEETEEWVRDAILKHALGNKREYVITEGRFIGMISPAFITPDEVEIGIWIAPVEQGKGYGKAALLLMLDINGDRDNIFLFSIDINGDRDNIFLFSIA